jgi:glutaminyl-peptide cyclotransferase
MRVQVVRSFPHDRAAFTQGLEYQDGRLYESTGLVGSSSLRIVDATTGEVLRSSPVDPHVFAEGLARVGGKLVQLTWQDGRAFVWSATTFAPLGEHQYEGEGWGLCFDGKRLVMSDGSAKLTFRDPETFAKTGELDVRREGVPLASLNELECVDDAIYANVWQDTHIARIDARTGEVTGWIDAAGLLRADEAAGTDVLNGIAWVPERRRFVITGKLWPRAFEVELVPAASP